MIEIIDDDVRRGGEKIGYIRGDDIHDDAGRKVGCFSESKGDIFDARGSKDRLP